MGSETPVIIEAASLSGNTMGAAISSSVAQRPDAIASRKGRSTSSRPQYQADPRCLVVDDAPSGVRAARAAGCVVPAVAGTSDPADLAGADLVLDGSKS